MKQACRFYRCETCGNLVYLMNEGGGTLTCCGEPMTLLDPNTVEASGEKHIPVITVKDSQVTVNVGSVDHPMTDAHYIEWIFLCAGEEILCRRLNPGDAPKAEFCVQDADTVTAYAYCNLHGLWKA